MECVKKTIILTNPKKEMCILTLSKKDNGIFANFKNYSHFSNNCVLGIVVGKNNVFRQNVVCNRVAGYEFKLSSSFALNENIGCVLLDADQPIAWGANGEVNNYRSAILEYIGNINKEANLKQKPTITKPNEQKGFNENRENIDNDIQEIEDDNLGEIKDDLDKLGEVEEKGNLQDVNAPDMQEDKITENIETYGCRDAEIMQVNPESLFEDTVEEIESEVSKAFLDGESTFFEMISEQIDELFATYPLEPRLEAVVPNSKWVKVDYENNGKVYVVGLVYKLETVKYVAYGVPSVGGNDSDNTLDGYGQWIPLDTNAPEKDGYFVMFQDALTGESIRI